MLGAATQPSQTNGTEELSADEKLQRQLEIEAADAANQAAEQTEPTAQAEPDEPTEAESEAEKIAGSFGAPVEGAEVENAEGPDAGAADTEIAAAQTEEQSQLRQLRAELTFDPEGTSAEAAAAAQGDWLAQAQAQAGETELQIAEPVSIPIESNFRLCTEPPVNGLIGVVVAPDGTLVEDPQLLKSTGYIKLNQSAMGAVLNTPFEASDSPVAYQFSVDVSYDAENCVEPEQILQSPEE